MTFKNFIFPIIVFLIGVIFYIIGALFKILHWGWGALNGAVLLTVASAFEVLSIIIVIVILLRSALKNKK